MYCSAAEVDASEMPAASCDAQAMAGEQPLAQRSGTGGAGLGGLDPLKEVDAASSSGSSSHTVSRSLSQVPLRTEALG